MHELGKKSPKELAILSVRAPGRVAYHIGNKVLVPKKLYRSVRHVANRLCKDSCCTTGAGILGTGCRTHDLYRHHVAYLCVLEPLFSLSARLSSGASVTTAVSVVVVSVSVTPYTRAQTAVLRLSQVMT